MPNPPAEEPISDALAAIWARSEPVIRERVETLHAAADALADGRLDEELREEAARAAHKLAGSLGTFGFPEGSRTAWEMERLLRADGPLTAEQGRELLDGAAALRDEISRPPGGGPEPPLRVALAGGDPLLPALVASLLEPHGIVVVRDPDEAPTRIDLDLLPEPVSGPEVVNRILQRLAATDGKHLA
ncbi:MAG TPA: Hpt domain-containing protein [Longimicrobiaceae bacterium]|nr:Hpt domain-containing protein [Longimicrobiaceae bacterium]